MRSDKILGVKEWNESHLVFGGGTYSQSACGIVPIHGWDVDVPLKEICAACACMIEQNDLAWLKVYKICSDFPAITIDRFNAAAKRLEGVGIEPLEHRIDTIAEWCIMVLADGKNLVQEFNELEQEENGKS